MNEEPAKKNDSVNKFCDNIFYFLTASYDRINELRNFLEHYIGADNEDEELIIELLENALFDYESGLTKANESLDKYFDLAKSRKK